MPRRSAEIKKGKPSPNSFFAPPWCSTYVRQLQRMCIHLYNKFNIIKGDCQGQKLSQKDFNFGYSVHFEALPRKQKNLAGKPPFFNAKMTKNKELERKRGVLYNQNINFLRGEKR